MAGLRKGKCYTPVKRAYTRKSKFKKKNYIKAVPTSKIVKFDLGDLKKRFPYRIDLICRKPIQIRHNALESSRTVVNRQLNEQLGGNYNMKIRVYPHHVLRENKMITGAGADRMQTGMQLSFGRPVGVAAQISRNQKVMSVSVDEANVDAAKKALKRATPRLPGKYVIDVVKIQ